MKNKELTEEEIWNIINLKYSDKSNYTKNFIFESINRYGDIYDYFKTNRVDVNRTKVIVTCRLHGDFEVDPSYFTKNKYCKGCPICNPGKTTKKTEDRFKSELALVFPQFTLDPNSKYINNNVHVKLHCNIHNIDFLEKPSNILCGKCGCPECNVANKIETRRKTAEDSFKKFCKDNCDSITILDYSKYIDQSTPLVLYCEKCNHEFIYRPTTFKYRLKICPDPCPNCCLEIDRQNREKMFLEKAISVWGDTYDFSGFYYQDEDNIFDIKCNICGDLFDIHSSSNFLRGQRPCTCNKSSGEAVLSYCLKMMNLDYTLQYRTSDIVGRTENSGCVIIDAVVNYNNRNYWIEYDGEQHYKYIDYFHKSEDDFINQLNRDINIYNYCENNNIVFIKIPYTYIVTDEIFNILEKVIINGESPFSILKYPIIEYPDKFKGEKIQYGE